MIDAAIQLITNQLNQYVRAQFDLHEEVAVAASPIEQDGAVAMHTNNKLAVFMVGLEKDSLPISLSDRQGSGVGIGTAYPLHLNLSIMISACFPGTNYMEALKFISQAIRCFQRQPVIDSNNTPGLGETGIEKLILDVENLSVHDLTSLWGMLGGKYQPSVLYRVRMLSLVSNEVNARVPAATDSQPAVG